MSPVLIGEPHHECKAAGTAVEERIRIVENLWGSIAADQKSLPLTAEQKAELDQRLDAYEADGKPWRLATDAIADIRRKL